jgi:hypothetical protein
VVVVVGHEEYDSCAVVRAYGYTVQYLPREFMLKPDRSMCIGTACIPMMPCSRLFSGTRGMRQLPNRTGLSR